MKTLQYCPNVGTGSSYVRYNKTRMIDMNNECIDGPAIDEFMFKMGFNKNNFTITLSTRYTLCTWGTAFRKLGTPSGGRATLYRHSVYVFIHELAHLVAPDGAYHGPRFGVVASYLLGKWDELMVKRSEPATVGVLEYVSQLDTLK